MIYTYVYVYIITYIGYMYADGDTMISRRYHIYIYIYIHIHTYIYGERERETEIPEIETACMPVLYCRYWRLSTGTAAIGDGVLPVYMGTSHVCFVSPCMISFPKEKNHIHQDIWGTSSIWAREEEEEEEEEEEGFNDTIRDISRGGRGGGGLSAS
jgi:hypothetical protein